jgi:multicomponent Na+:H+ antiporter subunit F
VTAFLLAAAAVVLVVTAIGLARVLRGPADADRMLAAQLLGTGGIAVVLLLAFALDLPAAIDVALVASLLAAFASIAFVRAHAAAAARRDETGPR